MERHKVIPAVYLVFVKDGKVLLLQRDNTGYMDGHYSLPAGHLDGNETAKTAAIREAKEEVGINLLPENLQLVHTMHRQVDPDDRYGHERIDMFFEAKHWQGEPRNAEPHKCNELAWRNIHDLPEKMVPEVKFALVKIAQHEPYSDFNFT